MKYALYEDPHTHRFALLALPAKFVEGDQIPITDADQWFGSREEAVAAVPALLNREEQSANPLASLEHIAAVGGKRSPKRKTIH